jgi:hypothetical protein
MQQYIKIHITNTKMQSQLIIFCALTLKACSLCAVQQETSAKKTFKTSPPLSEEFVFNSLQTGNIEHLNKTNPAKLNEANHAHLS